MSKKAASVNNRSGWLQKQEGTAWARTYTVLKGRDLSFYASDAKEERPYATVNLEDAVVGVPDISRVSKRHAIEVTLGSAAAAAIAAGAASGGAGAGAGSGSRSISSRIVLAADGKDEQEAWLQSLSVAAVPDAWPGGYDLLKRPQPLLYSLWLARNRPPAGAAGGPGKASGAAAAAAAAAGGSGSSSAALPATSPVPRLPALRSVPAWARKALLLRKFRLCSVTFDGVPSTVAGEEREAKRNTLLEILDWLDEACSGSGGGGSGSGGGSAIAPRAALGDLKFFEDMVGMLRATLFRTLPEAPPPSGDPEEEELPFADPQWGHLNVAYELLLRLVSADAVDLGFKKRVVDAPFVRSLLSLFDSEDARERDYLKTIAHRIYSKLTQRRALLRRAVCHVFFDFALESDKHNGIAELLEILASVINGFAVPIKDEHRVMLTKALLPLHKAKNLAAFHAQLSYCMALYVSKEHELTRDVIPGLLRLWPLGATNKQLMLLNELEDLIEYAQEDDAPSFAGPLALRLARCVGGHHFQVAERALVVWSNERFCELMLSNAAQRSATLPTLFPALYANQEAHWHEAIRTMSAALLERYADLDADLVARCRAEYEAQMAAAAAASSAERGSGASAASVAASGGAGSGLVLRAAGPGSLVSRLAALSIGGSSSPAATSAAAARAGSRAATSPLNAAIAVGIRAAAAAAVAAADSSAVPGTPGASDASAAGGIAGSAASPASPRAPGSAGSSSGLAGGAGSVGSGAGLAPISSPAAGTGGAGTPTGAASPTALHGHRAPAVRASQGFGVLADADRLPGHRDPAAAAAAAAVARGHGGLKDRMLGLGLGFLPAGGAGEADGEGKDE